jgi:hypothetical protein
MTSRYRLVERRSCEHLTHGVQAVDERSISSGSCRGRSSRGSSRDAELLHQRLAAVVAGADRDALEVEDLRDVVRVDPSTLNETMPARRSAAGRRA